MRADLQSLRRRSWLEFVMRKQLAPRSRAVIWSDAGDEVLLHADTLRIETTGGVLVASAELEAEEIGRERISVAFALGIDDAGGLVGATQASAQGAGVLCARWGETFEHAVLAALHELIALAQRHGFSPLLQLALGPALQQGRRR